MKKLFGSLFILTALSILVFSACKKKDPDPPVEPVSKEPTITINNSKSSSNTLSAKIDSITLHIVANADTDRKIKKLTIVRALTGQASVVIFTKADYSVKDLYLSYIDSITSGQNQLGITDGDEINYSASVEDDKGKISTEAVYKVLISSVAISPQKYIGAPLCLLSINPYRFIGTDNFFQRYRSGTDSTSTDSSRASLAMLNSAKIDFLYFYSPSGSVGNAFYSPDFVFAAGIANGWKEETDKWPVKNKTIFVLKPDITSSAFDALTGKAFLDELELVDFTVGAQSKLTNLIKDNVFAYKKSNGKRGFIKIGNPSTGNSGQILILIKSEI
ncbi:MAG: hypothetical protein Q8M15_08080 [Bacteroidota bacterium]|nr:hypothetical protein [Bacteroidota bacterium]